MAAPLTRGRRAWRIVNAVFGVAGLGLALALLASMLDRPLIGMRAPAYALVWLLAALGCNRALASAQDFVADGALRTTVRVAKWLLPWVLPIPLILAWEPLVLERQRAQVTQELAPLVAYADALPTGVPPTDATPGVAFPLPVEFRSRARGYVLSVQAAALDLDGTTLSYDSTTRRWERAHNDSDAAAQATVADCTLAQSRWRCRAAGEGPDAPEPTAD